MLMIVDNTCRLLFSIPPNHAEWVIMTVYGYIFLAADKRDLVSVADQQHGLARLSTSIGLTVTELFIEEGASLRKPLCDRPQGRVLLGQLHPRDTLVVLRSEWILASARSAVCLLEDLRKRSIALYCVDLKENITTPTARRLVISEGNAELVRTLLAALSVCESSSHGAAIKAAKRRDKRQGRHIGGPVPFGWQVDQQGFLRQHPGQQRVIETIEGLRGAGLSFREIAGRLKDELEISLSHEGIRRILQGDRARKERQQAAADQARGG
ncbi:MAG: recombinase family protein [Desulfofustis sp.]|nr:recombinase family protein [Desulfofustis sp.]